MQRNMFEFLFQFVQFARTKYVLSLKQLIQFVICSHDLCYMQCTVLNAGYAETDGFAELRQTDQCIHMI